MIKFNLLRIASIINGSAEISLLNGINHKLPEATNMHLQAHMYILSFLRHAKDITDSLSIRKLAPSFNINAHESILE